MNDKTKESSLSHDEAHGRPRPVPPVVTSEHSRQYAHLHDEAYIRPHPPQHPEKNEAQPPHDEAQPAPLEEDDAPA